jgi:serine protease Do
LLKNLNFQTTLLLFFLDYFIFYDTIYVMNIFKSLFIQITRHFKKHLLCFTMFLAAPLFLFSQTGTASLRDFVGLVNQTYHPGIVSIFEKMKADLVKEGATDAVKVIDIFLSGAFGSGFIYNDARGNLYILTNNHVIDQAHTVSITFERQDGTKRKIENLRIIATDEENDLAILAIPAGGERPFVTQGLTLLTRAIEEGEDVFSAGFPGLGATPLWQFGRGMISNASARFPKSVLDDTMIGPYVQHTAQVDSGNSGGPLLVVQRNAPSGYAVAGINSMVAYNRQAANFAIPVSTIRSFIERAFNPRPDTFRAALDQRIEKFAEGLGANRAVYPHIADYLSTECVGENAEYAIEEMYTKGNRTVRRDFISRMVNEGIPQAMGYAVAWTIEDNIRSGGAIRASVKEVTGSGDEYTVIFTINNKDVSSKWVREYGNWRIRTFGTVAAGDRSLIDKREKDKERKANLRIGNGLHLEAGFAHLFDKAPAAIYASLDYDGYGLSLYTTGSGFTAIGLFYGARGGFDAGNIGFMPYFRIGFNYFIDQDYEDFKDAQWGMVIGFPVAMMVQAGLKITTTHIPGFFIGASFQYNFFNMMDSDFKKSMEKGFSITAGYAF